MKHSFAALSVTALAFVQPSLQTFVREARDPQTTKSPKPSTKTTPVSSTTTSTTANSAPTGYIQIGHSTNKTLDGWYAYAVDRDDAQDEFSNFYFVPHRSQASRWWISDYSGGPVLAEIIRDTSGDSGYPAWAVGLGYGPTDGAGGYPDIPDDTTYLTYYDFLVQGGEPWAVPTLDARTRRLTFTTSHDGRNFTQACFLGGSLPQFVLGDHSWKNTTGNNCSDITLYLRETK